MKAVTWQGVRQVSVEEVPDPRIEQPTDAIVKITSTNICGSDLHLYETLGPLMDRGDVLGHEPMGIVQEVGSEVGDLRVGDRVVLLSSRPGRIAREYAIEVDTPRRIESPDVSRLSVQITDDLRAEIRRHGGQS